MGLLFALLFGLSAIAASPETEAPVFTTYVLTTCVPHVSPDFIGCDIPVPAYAEDELGYAGWSHGEPVTGP